MRRLRRQFAAADPLAASRAAEHLPISGLPAFRIVGGYHAMGGEMDPCFVLARLATMGALLALPAAVSREAPLVFRLARPGENLTPDAFGIPSPPPSAPAARPDLIVAPVLAFDRRGGRLGQGVGVYDRTLAALRMAGAVFVIGLAYAGQEVDEVPGEAHDQRLDAILTENGYTEV